MRLIPPLWSRVRQKTDRSRLSFAWQVFSEKACSTSLRDMLDLVALDLKNNHQSEIGTKQSFNYDVSSKNYDR